MTVLDDFIHRFQLQLPAQETQRVTDKTRQAAVLLPIIKKRTPTLLLTQRAANMRSHAGEIALPGGAADPGEKSPIITALREAYEEVAIPPNNVQILGQMQPVNSVGGFSVTPVVGIIPAGLQFNSNPSEVADVFEVPLADILNPSKYYFLDLNRKNNDKRVYFYLHEGRMIWGLTASILYRLATQVKRL